MLKFIFNFFFLFISLSSLFSPQIFTPHALKKRSDTSLKIEILVGNNHDYQCHFLNLKLGLCQSNMCHTRYNKLEYFILYIKANPLLVGDFMYRSFPSLTQPFFSPTFPPHLFLKINFNFFFTSI